MRDVTIRETSGKVSINNNKNIKIGSTVIIVIIILFIFGKGYFNSPEKEIIGTWQSEDGFTCVFQENGQYSHSGGWMGTYAIDGNTLTLCPVLNNPEVYTMSMKSGTLTITTSKGQVYAKMKKVK